LVIAIEFDTGTELERAAFPVEAAAKLFGHALELGSGDLGEVALGEFGLKPFELSSEALETFLLGDQGAVEELLPFDGTEVLDEVLVAAAPGDEGAFGDAELGGDASEAQALGTEFDELLNGFVVGHIIVAKRSKWARSRRCCWFRDRSLHKF
jgi:hypothetical protein